MPIRRHHRPCTCALAFAGLALLAATPVWAQDGEGDPGVVVTRTVNPRIAYRGVPVEDMPVAARATTFPARVFHGTLGHAFEQLAGDELLAQHGTAGLAAGIGGDLTAPGMLPQATTLVGADAQAAGRVPMGPGASIGGAVSGVTGGLADRVGGGVLQVVVPAASLQGDGP